MKKGLKLASTPSDSGASSADPDDGGGGGGGGGGVGSGRESIGGVGTVFKDQLLAASPDLNGLGNSEISLSKLPPKMPRTPPASSALQSLGDTYRPFLLERMSPYLPGVHLRPDGSSFFPVGFSLPPVPLAMLSSSHGSRDEQSEPIDLSMKSKSSSRSASSESPLRIDTRSPLLVDPGDPTGKLSPSGSLAPKPVPLDLSTFVRSKALSG
ncbi:hypothetical protein ZHAS_00011187 [Anopheles sinensis]|uniref:Uncharacterized protein n=1 Tax=Anopheles sinensis TaxID=74873 RepID=A0A084VZJ7_ANOSI|nr:hypothetical protein ZHAS_00011187 [Anopheles sinensis]